MDIRSDHFLESGRRSALGLAIIYNLLPEVAVHQSSVRSFQSHLQGIVKERAEQGCEEWRRVFSPRIELWRHPLK